MQMQFSNPTLRDLKQTCSMTDEPPISKTMRYKKITKPLLERKRRARINACLEELKDIMTSALQAEGENVSKLEKADILELTVRHLHKLNQSQRLGLRNPVEEMQRFQAGYSSCAQEATNFLLSTPGLDIRVGHRLLGHLFNPSVAGGAAASSIVATAASQPPPTQQQQTQQQQQQPLQGPNLPLRLPIPSVIPTGPGVSGFPDIKPGPIVIPGMAIIPSSSAPTSLPFSMASLPDVKPNLAQLVTSSLARPAISTVTSSLPDVKPSLADLHKMTPVRPAAVRPSQSLERAGPGGPASSRGAGARGGSMWKPYS